jgi:5-bromo-4-chloroindolyl phosphate hydrolysis protein
MSTRTTREIDYLREQLAEALEKIASLEAQLAEQSKKKGKSEQRVYPNGAGT